MGWESRRSYPVDASKKVTVQATPDQIGAWTAAARKMGKASPGAFVAWAADMYLALSAAYEKQILQHADECNPPARTYR
jgi:hypothetical protein